MLMRATNEVAQDLLPSGVLISRGDDSYEIKYRSTATGVWIRTTIAAVVCLGAILIVLRERMAAAPKAAVGMACLAFLAILVAASYPRLVIDAKARCLRRGWALFNRIGAGLSRTPIEDDHRVLVKVSDHDGEDRHNPLYEVVIRRPGLLKPDILLIALALPASDARPQLFAFAELVGRLLAIECDQHIDTSPIRRGLPYD
jgi:hypothetical protein